MHPGVTTGSRIFWMPAIRDARTEGFTIGKLSDLTGVNIETIRYYEKIGMLPAPPRTESGRRIYGPAESSCRDVREIAAHHLEDVRAKLNDLKKLERLLARTVARCSGKAAPDCPVLDILDVGRGRA